MISTATSKTTNHINLCKQPPFRKLRAYSFDPSLSLQMDTVDINNIVYKVRWEKLKPGPVGEYLEVLDYDPTVPCFYKPVDLDDRFLLAQDGLDPSESNPQFHQQMVYAVAMNTIQNFEAALGRKVLWASRRMLDDTVFEEFVQRLQVFPHALKDANAYYSPLKKAVLFGYFSSAPADETQLMPDSLIFTCLSHDIIAHEITHAILDGMHYYYNDPTNPDVLAFHEAFADIVALFQHFTFPDVLKHQIAKTRGNLSSQNLLGELAQQFGSAIGSYGSLRDAIGQHDPQTGQWQPKNPDPDEYRTILEPHARGSILVAAVFEAFLAIYKARVADLLRIASGGSGILPEGALHPDLVNRLATEASKAAKHVLNMCIRALDYCPPVDITFGDYLRAIITADVDLVQDDQHDYRLAFIDAFKRRGIYPEGIRTLSVESLQRRVLNLGISENQAETYKHLTARKKGKPIHLKLEHVDKAGMNVTAEVDQATQQLLTVINTFLRDYAEGIKYVNKREDIYKITRDYIRGRYDDKRKIILGLHRRIKTKFSVSTDFAKITGLAFVPDPELFGVRFSDKYHGPSFQIQNLRLINRLGPDGNQINQVVFSIVQRSGVVFERGVFKEHMILPEEEGAVEETMKDNQVQFQFRGGCTLIFDLDTLKLKYAIAKPLLDLDSLRNGTSLQIDRKRAQRQYNYQFGDQGFSTSNYALYFGGQLHNLSEPFSFLHQH